jgi:hypothetical protein
MSKYEVIDGEFGKGIKWDDNGVIRYIPFDESNADYQVYLQEQSTPSVIDEA